MKKILAVLAVCLVAAGVFFACRYLRCSAPVGGGAVAGWTPARQLDFAETLSGKGLNKEAVRAFEEYLGEAGLKLGQAAKIFYRVGNIYMDLYDYEKAAYYFYKAEAADPGADFNTALSQKLVSCLENIGLSSQARYETEKRASVSAASAGKKDMPDAVASVGGEQITQGQIDEAFNELPEWMRDNFTSPEGKIDFIKQYAANEALYRRAKRLGLENDAAVRKGVDQFRKQAIVQKLIQQQISDKVAVNLQDVKLYYDANKEKYKIEKKQDDGSVIKEERPFEEVSELVEYDYKSKKMQDEMQSLLNKVMQEEGVRIYEGRVSKDEKPTQKDADAAGEKKD